MQSLSFNLEDFIPYYVDIDAQKTDVYPSLPHGAPNTFYQSIHSKQEFSSLAYDPSNPEDASVPGTNFFKHQEFVARFLSPQTPYNRMIAIHAVGTGKCVHPHTIISLAKPVSIFQQSASISHLWELFQGGILIEDGTGEWAVPKENITVLAYNPVSNTIEPKRVKRLYRERVNTLVLHYSSGSNHLCCTFSHKLLTSKGFKSKCKVGQDIMLLNGNTNTFYYHPITRIDTEFYDGYVYDLEVEDHHTYIANGFVTHNTCLIADVAVKAIQESNNRPRIIVLTKSSLVSQMINEIAETCAKDFFSLPEDISNTLTKETRQKRNEEKVREWFDIQSVTQFCNSPDIELNIKYQEETEGKEGKVLEDECDLDQLHVKFSNTYLIIDEAHTLPSFVKTKKRGERQYKILDYLIHSIKGMKVLLLTATPMINEPYDLVNILKLILPANDKIRNIKKDTFDTEWFDPKTYEIKNPNEFMRRYLTGNISYLRSNVNIKVEYEGTPLPERGIKHTNLVSLVMDPHQASVCRKVYEQGLKDFKQEGYGIFPTAEYCTNFVFPDGSFGTKLYKLDENINEDFPSQEAEKKWVDIEYAENRSNVQSFRCNTAFVAYLKAKGEQPDQMLQQIKRCSVKYYYAIKKILESPTEKIFVWHESQFGGGMMLFAALLQEFGFSNIPKGYKELSQLNRAKRFMISSTQLPSPSDLLQREIFTNSKNTYGEYCQVIIGGEKLQEGFNIYDVQKMFILTPSWNMANLDQAIGRALRFRKTHTLPKSKQKIIIYRLCALLQERDTSKEMDISILSRDEYLYRTAEIKDFKIKQIEHLIKQSAVDCENNKAINVRKEDKPYTRECDYQSCELICIPNIQPPKQIISDTYNRFYGEKESYEITTIIQILFKEKFSYLFEELYEQIQTRIGPQKVSSILLARSLYSVIVNNVEIINRFGFPNYLREDRNLYFLTDDPSGSVVYSLQWYTSHPFPDNTPSFEDAQERYFAKFFDSLRNILDKYRTQPSNVISILNHIPYHLSQMLIETIVQAHTFEPDSLSTLSRSLYDIYSKYLIRMDGAIYYNKFKVPRKLSLDTKEWSNISNAEYEEILKKGQKTREISFDIERAKNVGYQGYIPIDYNEQKKFDQLKIKQLKLKRELSSGAVDRRLDRWGTKCGFQPFTKKGNIFLLFEFTKLSQQFDLQLPLQSNLPKVPNVLKDPDFKQFIQPKIELYDMYHIIADKLIETGNVIPVLFSLRLNPAIKPTNKEILSSIIGIYKQDSDYRKEKLEDTEAHKSKRIYSLHLTKKEIVNALKLYSESSLVIKSLFKKVMERSYSSTLDFPKQMTPEVIDVLSKAILLQDNDLCREIGLWLEKNQLLGIN
jgi:hypothetical protein